LIEIQKDALGQVASEVGRVTKDEKFVIATKNKGKLKEIQEILDGLDFEVVSMEEMGITKDIEESGSTFEENALSKRGKFIKLAAR